jgi:hypothetical protein
VKTKDGNAEFEAGLQQGSILNPLLF